MLDRFRTLFSAPSPRASRAEDGKRMAAAALMVEAATLDGKVDAKERATIRDLLQRHFTISETEAATLLAEAETTQATANHLLRFTRTIKDTYSPDERVAIIEMLWEVVYADGVVHPYEANLLRRVSGLLYVADLEQGLARKRVLARLGLGDPANSPA